MESYYEVVPLFLFAIVNITSMNNVIKLLNVIYF